MIPKPQQFKKPQIDLLLVYPSKALGFQTTEIVNHMGWRAHCLNSAPMAFRFAFQNCPRLIAFGSRLKDISSLEFVMALEAHPRTSVSTRVLVETHGLDRFLEVNLARRSQKVLPGAFDPVDAANELSKQLSQIAPTPMKKAYWARSEMLDLPTIETFQETQSKELGRPVSFDEALATWCEA